MANYIRYTSKNISEEDFDIEYKGYKCEEVDKFLDGITEDYKIFEEKIKILNKENESLLNKLKQKEDEFEILSSRLIESDAKVSELSNKGIGMVDIIKRLAEIEKKQS